MCHLQVKLSDLSPAEVNQKGEVFLKFSKQIAQGMEYLVGCMYVERLINTHP